MTRAILPFCSNHHIQSGKNKLTCPYVIKISLFSTIEPSKLPGWFSEAAMTAESPPTHDRLWESWWVLKWTCTDWKKCSTETILVMSHEVPWTLWKTFSTWMEAGRSSSPATNESWGETSGFGQGHRESLVRPWQKVRVEKLQQSAMGNELNSSHGNFGYGSGLLSTHSATRGWTGLLGQWPVFACPKPSENETKKF